MNGGLSVRVGSKTSLCSGYFLAIRKSEILHEIKHKLQTSKWRRGVKSRQPRCGLFAMILFLRTYCDRRALAFVRCFNRALSARPNNLGLVDKMLARARESHSYDLLTFLRHTLPDSCKHSDDVLVPVLLCGKA